MSIRSRRWIVAVVWIAVGLMLVWRGLPYAGVRPAEGVPSLSGSDTTLALALAAVLGIAKGFTALRKGARRAVTHLVGRGEQAPAWSVFSPAMIGLVAVMVGAGLALRLSPYDPAVKAWVIGILYPAIGLALMIGGLLATRVDPLPPRG